MPDNRTYLQRLNVEASSRFTYEAGRFVLEPGSVNFANVC